MTIFVDKTQSISISNSMDVIGGRISSYKQQYVQSFVNTHPVLIEIQTQKSNYSRNCISNAPYITPKWTLVRKQNAL